MISSSCCGCHSDCMLNALKSPTWHCYMQHRQILFVPTGGGNFCEWAVRFQATGCPEFHLLDREVGPETDRRQHAVQLVDARPGCRSFLTTKRSLENYLHFQAVAEAGGGEIQFGDDECVGSVLAHHWYERVPQHFPWQSLSRRARRRLSIAPNGG